MSEPIVLSPSELRVAVVALADFALDWSVDRRSASVERMTDCVEAICRAVNEQRRPGACDVARVVDELGDAESTSQWIDRQGDVWRWDAEQGWQWRSMDHQLWCGTLAGWVSDDGVLSSRFGPFRELISYPAPTD